MAKKKVAAKKPEAVSKPAPKKPSASKPAPLKKASPAPPASNKKAPVTFYVSVPAVRDLIGVEKPAGELAARKFAEFAAAKSAAIDALIESIEQAEQRLDELKRAGSYDEFRSRNGVRK